MQGEDIVVLTAGTTTDPYSQEPVEDWTNPTERTVTTVSPWNPTGSDEPVQDARNQLDVDATVYLPAGDPITRLDRVRRRGVVYTVYGEPQDWGVHIAVRLKRSEG